MTEGAIKSSRNGSFDRFLLALNTTDLSFNSNPVLSTNELEMLETIKHYPNPTTGIVQFELSDDITYNYILTNCLGQQLKKGKLNNANKTISLSELSKGIYIVTLVAPPKQQAPIDSIVSLETQMKYLKPLTQTAKLSTESYDYIVIVYWNRFMGRQSMRLIRFVQKNIKLKNEKKVKLIYANTDNIFARQ